MFQIEKNRIDCNIELKIILGNIVLGNAKLTETENYLTLDWLEIIEEHQHKGCGTYILDHIVENLLHSDSTLEIKPIVDSEMFFNQWFVKRGFSQKQMMNWESADVDIFISIKVSKAEFVEAAKSIMPKRTRASI